MIKKLFFLNTLLMIILALGLINGQILAAPPEASRYQTDTPSRSDAILLVNSSSPDYEDFQHYIQPYLEHFGIPYTTLDIATTGVPADIEQYALIVIGHRGLDPSGAYLDATEEGYISEAVYSGTGLVNFDNDLSVGGSTPSYQFVQDVFGFGYGSATSGSGVSFPAGNPHYITERHEAGTSISTGSMTLPGIILPGDVTAIAITGSQPFLAVTSYGSGRGVQWGSYDWMSYSVKGPVYGLDDLVWRSLVWAAHKPFVMQGMPPFVTMRSDDESGNFEWIHIANEFGIKPWVGLFYLNIDESEATDLSALTRAGLATAAIHANDGSFFYFNHGSGDYPDATVAANFAAGTAWHINHNIPISKFVLPHYYEFGTNVFQGLSDWGVEFVGTMMAPGNGYGAPWIMNGPFRKYEAGGSSAGLPVYYADFMTIPGHPEFDGRFFNCVTEIRDDAGYEWYPNLSDVAGTIGRGTRQVKRALDSMALATLFTHGYYISGSWNASAPANWRAILQGITDNLAPYDPIYVTMDDACRYIRATHTSNITSAFYNSTSNQVTATFSGVSDVETMFYVFMDGEGYVMVNVPAFTGSTTVAYTIPGPLDHIVVTPNPASVVAGTSLQFTATGYDASDNPIPNLSFVWNVVNGGGSIDGRGRFTAGTIPGTYVNTVVASRNSISGAATVQVTEPVLDHFEIAPITSPKYVGAPFSVTIRARDSAGNLVVGYSGMATLSDSTGTVSPNTIGPFSGGVWSGPVTIGSAAASVTLTVSSGTATGTSNAFEVLTAPTCPCSIWESSVVPAIEHNPDGQAVELGVKFRAAADGYITALRFYRGASNTGSTFVGHLWSADGTLLAEATFPTGTPAGWQQVTLPTPVPIVADTTYIASYHTSTGYAVDRPYFTLANRSAYERPPLRALVDGEEGGNGVYFYGPSGSFPSNTYQSSNYWVDMVFVTSLTPPSDTTPPTVISTSPSAGASDVNVNADVTVTFNEAMDPASINGSTFALRDASNAIVPASVSYDSATRTARLDPIAPLAYSTTYTSTVKGGPYGVTDLAGNPLAVDYIWSFATAAAPPTLHHFNVAVISSPQTADVPFPITVTAYDTNGNIFTSYTGPAALTTSAGTLTPVQTGAFVNGVWTGFVKIASESPLTGVTLTVADGAISGLSNSFDLQLAPPAPPFYTVTSASYEQMKGVLFQVTVTAYPGTTINLWEDNHQDPVLDTFTNPLLLNDHDGKWDEFWYVSGRPFPALFAGHNEWENNGLQPIHFFAVGIPNGQYQVYANLYTPYPTRYYYGYTEAEALSNARYVDIAVGAGGSVQFAESLLGTINISNGRFDLWAGDGDSSGAQYFYGWAHIRLVPVTPSQQINLWENNHQNPVLETTTDPAQLVPTDGRWTEFYYPSSRPFPGVFAAVDEENYGLPVMHFFASGIPNGTYEVLANLYDNAPMRYYYGYTPIDPKAHSVDVPGCFGGTQFREYSLGSVTITDGSFDLYVRDADYRSSPVCGSTYPFFGWAWIRLVPTGLSMSSTSSSMLFDGDGDGIFGEPGDEIKPLVEGTFTIMARDTTPGTGVIIRAEDVLGRFGFNTYSILNRSPDAIADTATTDEDSVVTITVLVNDSDPDGDTLTVANLSEPAHGTVTLNPDQTVTYTPNPDFNGSDSFTYQAYDGYDYSNVASVSITVNSVNDPPMAQGQDVTTDEDTPLAITLTATDVDGDALTYSLVTPPVHGALSGTPPSLTYMPNLNYHGPDSFAFSASDGYMDSNVATVAITVNPVNDAPLAYDQSTSINEDTSVDITLVASDVDGDVLTYSIVTGPVHGTLSGTLPNSTYTPAADYFGTDSFTFKVNDGAADSNVATVSIMVNEVNDAPLAVNDAYTVDEDNPLSGAVLANDSDPDNADGYAGNEDDLTAVLVSGPSHGTLVLYTDGSFTYMPELNYNGSDSFIYRAYDGVDYSNQASVSITVNPVNDPPTIAADQPAITVDEGQTAYSTGTYTDPDPDQVEITASTGVLTKTGTNVGTWSWSFATSDGPTQSQTITITADDRNGGVSRASFYLAVRNLAPVLIAPSDQSADEGALTSFALGSFTDPGADSPWHVAVKWGDSSADEGFDVSATGDLLNRSHAYADDGNYIVTITVTDKDSASDSKTFQVKVNNVAPVVSAGAEAAINEGDTFTGSGSFTDPGADTWTATVDYGDGSGEQSLNLKADKSFALSHVYVDNGKYTVTVCVADDDGGIGCDSLVVTVNNLAPVVSAKPATQQVQYSDGIQPVVFTASDVTADEVTITMTWSADGNNFISGLPADLVLSSPECKVSAGTRTCSWSVSGAVHLPAGEYALRGLVQDDDGARASAGITLTVGLENAAVSFDDDNPVAVQVASPGGSSGTFKLTVYVREATPDSGDRPYPGDIVNASLSMTLQPVGPGSSVMGNCSPVSMSGSGYGATRRFDCYFSGVGVNTYTTLATVIGEYYTGSAEDVLTVYDPSLGFASGGGWFYWPGTANPATGYLGDRTNFGFTMKYNKRGGNVQGSLLLIRHLADGTIYRLKSNALYGLSLGEDTTIPMGWASFSGKATYQEPGWLVPIGNYEFVTYVEDRNEPGAGTDRFWIEVVDKDRIQEADLSMARPATANSIPIRGGNIIVPHRAR